MKKLLSAAVAITLILGMVSPALSQGMLQKEVTLTWSIKDREVDVQHYQVYMQINDAEIAPYGDRILVTGQEYVSKETISHVVTFQIPEDEDTTVFFSVLAIDTSNNLSHLAKPWVGYKYMNEPPATPTGLSGSDSN